jgi:hypothetical protein
MDCECTGPFYISSCTTSLLVAVRRCRAAAEYYWFRDQFLNPEQFWTRFILSLRILLHRLSRIGRSAIFDEVAEIVEDDERKR